MSPFRPFDEGDWGAFAGCDSTDPRIAYVKAGPSLAEDLTVILDGRIVSVLYEGVNYQHEYPTRQLAEDFGLLAITMPETLTHARLSLIFGEAIGEF